MHPEKIYLPTPNGQPDCIWNAHWAHGKDVEYIRADIHEAEIDALKAENAAIRLETERLRLNLNNHRVTLNKNGAELDATYAALALMNAVAKTMNKEIEALKIENAELTSALSVIHDLAHDKSTGPAIDDGYWEIRALAGEALEVK